MALRDSAIRRTLHHLALAPFASDHWAQALEGVAAATNAAVGQITGAAVNTAAGVSKVSPGWEGIEQEWLQLIHHSQVSNPFAAPTAQLREGADIAEFEIGEKIDLAKDELFNEFHVKHGVPHVCNYKAWITPDVHWVLSTIRTTKQGPIDQIDRRDFRLLGRAVKASLRDAMAVGDYGARLLTGTLDGINLAAFVCDRSGRVRAMTQAAESIIRCGEYLTMRAGVLATLDNAVGKTLADRIASNATVSASRDDCRNIALYNRVGRLSATARLVNVPPQDCSLGINAEKIIIIDEHATVSAAEAERYGLSAAELKVATALLKGTALGAIARERAVSIETIRTQSKSIYSKMEVRGQRELMNRHASAKKLNGLVD